jgi:hypothetical protein
LDTWGRSMSLFTECTRWRPNTEIPCVSLHFSWWDINVNYSSCWIDTCFHRFLA